MNIVLALAAGYLLGSISFPIIITRIVTGKDIHTLGDHNPGAANVGREIGDFFGELVWCLDVLKGVAAMALSQHIFKTTELFVFFSGMTAVIGHCWPVYFKFKGGKGIATTGGTVLYMMPKLFPFAIIIWFIVQRLGPRNKYIVLPAVFLFYILLFIFYKADFRWLFPPLIILMAIVMFVSREAIKDIK